ncbi:MAG: PH domain-containing protein [Ruminococcus sp.]|nr:PH domain-containing protein [Ruminococcus sp.]
MSRMNKARNAVSRFFRHRQHPIKLISYTSRNLWLLLIPLSRYLIASRFDFQAWFMANWIDILAISFIFAFAIVRWVTIRFDIEPDGIVAHTGFLGMVRTKVFFSQITSVSFCQSWYSRPLSAHTIYIETNARTLSSQDLKLVLSTKNANLLYDFISTSEVDKPKVTFSPRKSHLLVFSLLFSSTLSGMLVFGTFMFEAYRIVGIETEREILDRVNGELNRIDSRFLNLFKTIPTIILIIAGMILLGRLLSFVSNLARHWSFTVTRNDSQFYVRSGVLIKRRHIINQSKVNYYDLNQTLLMKIFKICSVRLDCTGYGKSSREIDALIPITTYKQMNASLKLLVPDLPKPKPEVKTGSSDVHRFVTIPIILCALPPAIIELSKYFFGNRFSDLNALIVIAAIPLIWFVIVKTAAAFNTSVGFSADGCVINYCRWFQFHKIFLPKANISKIRITRNPLQMVSHTCNLWIYIVGEKSHWHKIKYMPYEQVREVCLREGYLMFD